MYLSFVAVRTGEAVDPFRFGKERIYAVYRQLGDDEGYLSLLLDIEVTHPTTESCNLEWSHFACVEKCFVQCYLCIICLHLRQAT
jgi:hypothetical protein